MIKGEQRTEQKKWYIYLRNKSYGIFSFVTSFEPGTNSYIILFKSILSVRLIEKKFVQCNVGMAENVWFVEATL